VQITHASQSAPGRANEDYACTGPEWAVILDGATPPQGVESGCIHDVPWLVRRLAAAISSRLTAGDPASLPDTLAAAIEQTCDAHSATCDLTNPDSPSSTVAIARVRDNSLDYLTLGDSPVVLRHRDETFTPIADDRAAHLPGGRPYTIELVRAHRNKANGFWVASTDPRAAYHAVTGTAPVANLAEVGLFTDGITRLVDWYGFTWPVIFACMRSEGPARLIGVVRDAEREKPHRHAKTHDDATAIYMRCG
jgi:Protein phosphatase 2C